MITDLSIGGAQGVLSNLVRGMDPSGASTLVVSLTDIGPMGERLREAGYQVEALGMSRGIPSPMGALRLARLVRAHRADIVQTWMYHCDLVGGIAARLARTPVVWGIRNSDLHADMPRRRTKYVAEACARLSPRLPDAIVSCSETAAEVHRLLGYHAGKLQVIPNGIDTSRFRPSPDDGSAVRDELGIPSSAPVVGLLARFDPQKDFPTFFSAAAVVARALPQVHFVLAGGDVTPANALMSQMMSAARPGGCWHVLGRRDDPERLMNALDVLVSSSAYGEGFPNVLAEAIAVGVPCVATDVGDSALLVDDEHRVVARRAPEALAAAVLAVLSEPDGSRRERSERARARIASLFTIEQMVDRYRACYESVLQQRSADRAPALAQPRPS